MTTKHIGPGPTRMHIQKLERPEIIRVEREVRVPVVTVDLPYLVAAFVAGGIFDFLVRTIF